VTSAGPKGAALCTNGGVGGHIYRIGNIPGRRSGSHRFRADRCRTRDQKRRIAAVLPPNASGGGPPASYFCKRDRGAWAAPGPSTGMVGAIVLRGTTRSGSDAKPRSSSGGSRDLAGIARRGPIFMGMHEQPGPFPRAGGLFFYGGMSAIGAGARARRGGSILASRALLEEGDDWDSAYLCGNEDAARCSH